MRRDPQLPRPAEEPSKREPALSKHNDAVRRAQWRKLFRRIRMTDDEDDVDGAIEAAEELNRIATEADLPRLKRMMRDENRWFAEQAATPIIRLMGIKSLPLMVQAVVQGSINGGLERMIADLVNGNKKAAFPYLLPCAKNPDAKIREIAVFLFACAAPESTLDSVRWAVDDPNAGVRVEAARHLSSFRNDSETFECYVQLLGDSVEEVRYSAVGGLAELGDLRALPKLEEIVATGGENIRNKARAAIHEIKYG